MPQSLNRYSILYKKKILQNGLSLRSRNIWQLEESSTQDKSNTFSRTTSPVSVPTPVPPKPQSQSHQPQTLPYSQHHLHNPSHQHNKASLPSISQQQQDHPNRTKTRALARS